MQPSNEPTFFWGLRVSREDLRAVMALPALRTIQSDFELIAKEELHCTMLFVGPNAGQLDERPYSAVDGAECQLRINFIVATDRIACAAVDILDDRLAVLCKNKHPHLTLALAPGVSAVESNDVLAEVAAGKWRPQWNGMNMTVNAKVKQYFPWNKC